MDRVGARRVGPALVLLRLIGNIHFIKLVLQEKYAKNWLDHILLQPDPNTYNMKIIGSNEFDLVFRIQSFQDKIVSIRHFLASDRAVFVFLHAFST